MYGRLGSSYLARATSAACKSWKGAGRECASPLAARHHSPLHSPTLPLPHPPSDLPVSSSLFQRVSASNSLFRFARTRHRNNGRLLPDPPLWAESHTHTHTQLRALSGPSRVPLCLLPLGNGYVRRSTAAASPYSMLYASASAFRMTVLQSKGLLAST